MKRRSSKEKYGPLLIVLAVILGGLYAGGQTHHYHNPVVAFGSLGLLSLGFSKFLGRLFKKLPRIFKPLYLVMQASVACSFFVVLFYLFK